jgi:hypothetical protein
MAPVNANELEHRPEPSVCAVGERAPGAPDRPPSEDAREERCYMSCARVGTDFTSWWTPFSNEKECCSDQGQYSDQGQ